MVITIAFYGALCAALAYLALYGGKTGLWGGSLFLATSLLSLAINRLVESMAVVILMMTLVDVLSLGWRMALAFVSSRRWPIWVAAFQVNVVAAHVSIWLVPAWRGELYYAMVTVWAIPTLLAMIIGTSLDNRHERRVRTAAAGVASR
jgi:hypothetical protein